MRKDKHTASPLENITDQTPLPTAPEVPGARSQKRAVLPSPKKVSTPGTIRQPAIDPHTTLEEAALAHDPYADPETDAAVVAIVRQEADQLLESNAPLKRTSSESEADAEPAYDEIHKPGQRAAWWTRPWIRRLSVVILLLLCCIVLFWPTSRYTLLNMTGVRSSASVTVVDGSTGQPLKNVVVVIGDKQTKTNADGLAVFSGIQLGKQVMHIERVAFARVTKELTIGWGSNPLGQVGLQATGATYMFSVTDFASGKPLEHAEIVSGEASAFSDKKGRVTLTIDKPRTMTMTATMQLKGYRKEMIQFDLLSKKITEVIAVPSHPIVYVADGANTYNLMKVDSDGKNRKLLLAGTGNERSEMSVASSPDGQQAALVSSRSTKRDPKGAILDTLTVVNVQTSQAVSIDDAQSIKLINWVGATLIYLASYDASNATATARQRIIAYDTDNQSRAVLATGDVFSSVLSSEDYLYYAVNAVENTTASYTRIRLDGGGKYVLLNEPVARVVRASYDQLSLQTEKSWYNYKIGGTKLEKTDEPDALTNQRYVRGPGGKQLRISTQNARDVLTVYQPMNSSETALTTEDGAVQAVTWLNETTVTYTRDVGGQTTVYTKSLLGGQATKVADGAITRGLLIQYNP